ncbi:MAG: Gfo/Idh/MocA family oxidoreductase [Desulfobacterales bacterium]
MINIAIIGYGVMGRHHFRVLETMNTAKVIAVCDPNISELPESRLYNDIDLMLSEEAVDAVILSTPTSLHTEIGLKCIEKGIHLLIEKPIASNSDDGRKLKECASRNNTKLVLGYVERFNPVVLALKEEIRNKEIYSICNTRIGPIPPRISDVGVLTDLAVHDIDLIRFLTNREIVESNIFKSKKIHNHNEDNAIIALRLENGLVANITTNWLTPFKRRTIEIATSKGYYEADLINQTLNEYSSSEYIDINHSYVVRNCFVRKGEPLMFELKAFLKYLSEGIIGDLADPDDSIKTLEILGA